MRPLVGTHDDRVVAARDIGDQPIVRHDDTEPRPRLRGALDRRDARLERRVTVVLLAERAARQRQVDAVDVCLVRGGFGDREVRNREGIE